MLTLNFFEPWLLNTFFTDPQQLISATLISLSITKFIIFPWQLVGLLRASDKDYLKHGNINKTRLIQLLMVLAIAYVFSYSISLIQSATYNKKQHELAAEYISFQQQDKNYKLTLRNNSTQLVISGEIEIGITKAVSNILKKNVQISSIALNSIGGHIYEGRGLSKLFTRQGLVTYVYKQCSSACTTAFSGGRKRYLGSSGKLGFHQYKLDLQKHKRSVGFHDASAEQERDLKLFKSRGIENSFLKKIFNENSDSMWFPSHNELITAKVIDGVIDTD
ncbi:MAG: hypothetical protein V7749_17335 [Cocleimonas sp.]